MADPNQQPDANSHAVFRILDANSNRAAEACRVIEDYCRFSLGDEKLSAIAKGIRHGIRTVTLGVAEKKQFMLLAMRDTEHDIGTRIQLANQLDRQDIGDVVTANFSRLQESLRVLEEFVKPIDSQAAAGYEAFRYESYRLQKTLLHFVRGRQMLNDCLLCVLTDAAESEAALAERVALLISAGVDMLQLREKRLEDGQLLARARIVRELTADRAVLFVVNDRPDICALAEADGVHVGQTDLSVNAVRRIVGQRIIGVSTHSLEQAEQAVRDGADYIGVGPMFASQTKRFDKLPGLPLLRQVAAQVNLPILAIGGVSQENVAAIVECGGRRVAASAGVLKSADPAAAAKRIREVLAAAQR